MTYEERQKQVSDYLAKCRAQKMACGGTVHKMASGGIVPAELGPEKLLPPTIGPDVGSPDVADSTAALLSGGSPTSTGTNVIDTIKAGFSGAGKAMASMFPTSLLEGAANVTEKASPAIAESGPAIVNAALGTDLAEPKAPAPVPPPPPGPPPVQTSNKAPASKPQAADDAPKKGAFQDLFDQDPTKLTKGFNPEDRQAVVNDMLSRQRSGGNLLAMALAGLGDAIAARGGVNTDSLGKLLRLETEQRREAMANFDAARTAAVQNFQLKTQMGDNEIKRLAAQDAYGLADPHLAEQIGAPRGTLNKDLPLYLQIYSAKANQAIANGDQILKATKQASEENDNYNKAPGALHVKQTPEERQQWITNRTNDLVAQSHGLVKVQQHGHIGYVSKDDFMKARKSDPTVQQVAY